MKRIEKVIQARAARDRLLPLLSPRWDDLRVSVATAKLRGNSDPTFASFKTNGSGSTGVYSYNFSATTNQELFFSVQLPHAWKEGTSLRPHAHWCSTGSATGNVIWGLEYAIADIGGVFGNSVILTTDPLSVTGAAFTHYVSSFGTIDMTDMDASAVILCRVFRDATTDTFAGMTFLTDIDFHYLTDTPGGSLDEYIK